MMLLLWMTRSTGVCAAQPQAGRLCYYDFSAARPAAAAPTAGLLGRGVRHFFRRQVVAVVDPHLDADVALCRLGLGEAVFDLRPEGGERDAALHADLAAGHFRAA